MLASAFLLQLIGMLCVLHLTSAPLEAAELFQIEIDQVPVFGVTAMVGAVASSLLAGQIFELQKPRHVFVGCYVLLAVGIGFSASGVLWTGYLGALIIGISYGMVNPVTAVMLNSIQTQRPGLVFSIKQSSVPVAAGLALAIGYLAAATSSLLVFVIPVLLIVMGLILKPRGFPDSVAIQRPIGPVSIWSDPHLRYTLPIGLLLGSVQMIVLTVLPSILLNSEIAPSRIYLFLTLAAVAGFLGRLFWGWLADRVGLSESLGYLCGLCTLCCGGALLGTQWFVWLLPAFGFLAVGWNGVFMALVRGDAPEHAASASGSVMAYVFLGGILGPLIFAQATDLAGLNGGLLLAGCVALTAMMFARRKSHHTG